MYNDTVTKILTSLKFIAIILMCVTYKSATDNHRLDKCTLFLIFGEFRRLLSILKSLRVSCAHWHTHATHVLTVMNVHLFIKLQSGSVEAGQVLK